MSWSSAGSSAQPFGVLELPKVKIGEVLVLSNRSCEWELNQLEKRHGVKNRGLIRDLDEQAVTHPLEETPGLCPPGELPPQPRFDGLWKPEWLLHTISNAGHDRIKVETKTLSSSSSGVAQMRYDRAGRRFRIVIHGQLDEPNRYAVLCHELAHIYLGHLGANADGWWPRRSSMPIKAVEFEAKSVAVLVTAQLGLVGANAEYLRRYFDRDVVPNGVSLEHVVEAAGRLELMARQNLPPRQVKKLGGGAR